MPKYKLHWTGDYLSIDDLRGHRVGFKCHSKKKASFFDELVVDANLGAQLGEGQDKPENTSPDLDDAFHFTEEQ